MLGAKRIASAAAIASTTPGAASRLVGTLVVDAVDLVGVPTTDEPLLEREPPGRRRDVRAKPIVRRRQDPCGDACSERERRGHLRERRRVRSASRAHEVEPDVAVAEPEPVLPSPARRRLERVPGLAGSPPAALGVDEPAERVEEAVEVGRDVQAEDLEVVTDVSDDGQLPGLRGPRRAHARSARRRPRPTAGRPSRGNGEERARARAEASAEALEVGVGVDVELELGDADGRERRVSAEAIGASRAVERREDARIGQRERVRRSVRRLDQREPGVREPAEGQRASQPEGRR